MCCFLCEWYLKTNGHYRIYKTKAVPVFTAMYTRQEKQREKPTFLHNTLSVLKNMDLYKHMLFECSLTIVVLEAGPLYIDV